MVIATSSEELLKIWRKVFGDNTVIRTSDRWDNMVKHLGYASIEVTPGVANTFSSTILTDRQLVEKAEENLEKAELVPDHKLTNRTLAHLKLARAIASYFPGVASIHASLIPRASDRVKTAGLYDMKTQEILLHLETLEKARDTIDAMVHELGHHVARTCAVKRMEAEDLQPLHTQAMTYVAARIFQLAAEKKFDEYLKEAMW